MPLPPRVSRLLRGASDPIPVAHLWSGVWRVWPKAPAQIQIGSGVGGMHRFDSDIRRDGVTDIDDAQRCRIHEHRIELTWTSAPRGLVILPTEIAPANWPARGIPVLNIRDRCVTDENKEDELVDAGEHSWSRRPLWIDGRADNLDLGPGEKLLQQEPES